MEEPLPIYATDDEGHDSLQNVLTSVLTFGHGGTVLDLDAIQKVTESQQRVAANAKETDEIVPVLHYPMGPGGPFAASDEVMRAQQTIVNAFFNAVEGNKSDTVALFIDNHLTTAQTTDWRGRTPLLAAVTSGHIRMVQELIDFGADPDAFGVESKSNYSGSGGGTDILRTPLQLAASIGNLALVKLFIECYRCDDSKIAPDGQLALRLAAQNGHREIVEYLPARKGGGWLRWKIQHAKAMKRVKRALEAGRFFLVVLVWEIPKFFVWYVPKHCIFLPIVSGSQWCWKNRKRVWPWCKSVVQRVPVYLKKGGMWIWKVVKATPEALFDAGKGTWTFCTKTLPSWLKHLFVKRLPNAIMSMLKWISHGLRAIGDSLRHVTLKTISLLHTTLAAVISFFRHATFQDIWNGLCSLVHGIFVTFPQNLWKWLRGFEHASYNFMKIVFGASGKCVWYICYGAIWLAMYIPRKLWVVSKSLAGSLAHAWHEFRIWMNPKVVNQQS